MVQVEESADLLAMGTAAGTVLIYSTAKGALHCTLVSFSASTHTSCDLQEWYVSNFEISCNFRCNL